MFLHSKLKEMLEIYGVNKGLIFISQRGRKYNKRTIQQIVKNAAREACSKRSKNKKEGNASYSET